MTMDVADALPRPTSRAGGWAKAVLRRPTAAGSVAVLLTLVLSAALAPVIAPYDPVATDLGHTLEGPSRAHLLGTDSLGRDVLSRLLHGGQSSWFAAMIATLTALVAGVPTGLLAGFLGGWFDRTVMWLADVALSIPIIVVLLVIAGNFGNDEAVAMVALGALTAPGLARVVRSVTLAVREEPYIRAARVAGLTSLQIVWRHVLPRAGGAIIVQASLLAGLALLAQAGLGFLGLGAGPQAPTWGNAVADASTVVGVHPWLLVPSGLAIVLAVTALGLLGDAVRDATGGRAAATRPARVRPPSSPSRRPVDAAALLDVADVSVALPESPDTPVISGVTFSVASGESVGLIGESGSGKTLTGLAILGLLPQGATVTRGSVCFDGEELLGRSAREMGRYRGRRIALISQDPISSLDPAYTVGQQLGELVRRHGGGSRPAIRARVLELLARVNLPDPDAGARRYPHELSGGMAQRVNIASALAGRPDLLIADEPTTALDVTVQREILDLLRWIQRDTGMAVILISHDWGVVTYMCSRVLVMYAGEIVEEGPAEQLLARPAHPYTAALMAASPQLTRPGSPIPSIPGTVPVLAERRHDRCRFLERCRLATSECAQGAIEMTFVATTHEARCVHTDDLHRAQQDGGSHVAVERA
jgi:peptide/nickel transport system permease protein